MKVLKRQLNKEGLFRELKRRRFFVKPSIKKKLKIKEAKKNENRHIDVQDLYGTNNMEGIEN